MKTYRIKIEETGNWKHVKNITIDTDNIDEIIERIQNVVICENEKAIERFIIYLIKRQESMMNLAGKDTFDSASDEISRKDFLQNEIDFEIGNKK
jgi:hypothetical protein